MADTTYLGSLEPKEKLQERYTIEKVLGANGLSITYQAFDTFREEKVVIKELFPTDIVARDPNNHRLVTCKNASHDNDFIFMQDAVIKEAKTLMKLYPLAGIANVKQYFEENQTVYVLMEYIEGVDLATFVKGSHLPMFPMKDTLKLLYPMMESLAKIHEKGIVHGKIHPGAIYVTPYKQAILLGFGDPMEAAALESVSKTDARIPGYSPAEQYIEGAMLNAATDVYAMAAMIYELVTGQTMPTFYERIDESIAKEIAPASEINTTVMDYQSKALEKALSSYQFDRYTSMTEFKEAIAQDEFDDLNPAPLLLKQKRGVRSSFLTYQRMRYVGIACILVLLIYFVPRIYNRATAQTAEVLYTKLDTQTIEQQVGTIVSMSNWERKSIANDYNSLDEDDHVIYCYDFVRENYVRWASRNVNTTTAHYMKLDFRLNNTAVFTIVKGNEKTEYTITLKKSNGTYQVEEKCYTGSSLSSYTVYNVVAEK